MFRLKINGMPGIILPFDVVCVDSLVIIKKVNKQIEGKLEFLVVFVRYKQVQKCLQSSQKCFQ